ncbi:MAG: hypothetical protein V4437_01595 [Patescibacteria group bacterium]
MVKESLGPQREIAFEEVFTELKDTARASLRECPTYLAWLDQEMGRIEKTQEATQREKEQFALSLKSARLLKSAGRTSSARFAYEDALFQAQYSTILEIQTTIPTIKNEMKTLPDGKGITERPLDE